MDRTGVPDLARLESIFRDLPTDSLRGLHWYDGHVGPGTVEDRILQTHEGLDRLSDIVRGVREMGFTVAEVITSGTPGFLHSLSYSGWRSLDVDHQVSPGTVVYWDEGYGQELPELDFEPAVLVMSRIISHPKRGLLTCDAGHKTVAADRGDPVARVVDHDDLTPIHPSEEHLPIRVPEAKVELPALQPGQIIYLVPIHVCPTVNNADEAILVDGDRVLGVTKVDARGHDLVILGAKDG